MEMDLVMYFDDGRFNVTNYENDKSIYEVADEYDCRVSVINDDVKLMSVFAIISLPRIRCKNWSWAKRDGRDTFEFPLKDTKFLYSF